MYDDKYLKDTLILIDDLVDDLDTWSVYNDDKYSQEVEDIKRTLHIIKFRSQPKCSHCGKPIECSDES